MEPSQAPVIAFVGLYDKQNYPVIARNYLVEFMQLQKGEGAPNAAECEDLRMQISMLVFSVFDVFDERQRVVANLEGESQYKTSLGLLMESFIGSFELDCYGYITTTNYKIVVLKNEMKTN